MSFSRLARLFCLGFAMISFFGLFGSPSFAGDAVPTIEAPKLEAELHGKKPPFLLDVREPSEYQESRIEGATLIPLGDLPNRLSELPKDRPIVVYCRSGHRSGMATSYLIENGFKNVESLAGGMIVWSQTHQCGDGKAC